MKLTDLSPEWVGHGGEGVTQNGAPVARREAVGVSFNCPCGCAHELFIPFSNPADGLGRVGAGSAWGRAGDTFETLTLTPSIQREFPQRCWHGYVTAGEISTCP